MKIVGIVGRAYYNKDNQKIFQIHETTRRVLSKYEDVTCIAILPNGDYDYVDIIDGKDSVDSNKLDYVLKMCDGFIVPGGTYSYKLDEYVINYAINNNKPLIGICLGFQIMCSMYAADRNKFDMTKKGVDNFHFGNSREYKHSVDICDNTRLKNILKSDSIMVNSVHHDIVNFDLNDLIINARSSDGVIEGVEYPNKNFIIGLQWHPEYIDDINTKRIFDEHY